MSTTSNLVASARHRLARRRNVLHHSTSRVLAAIPMLLASSMLAGCSQMGLSGPFGFPGAAPPPEAPPVETAPQAPVADELAKAPWTIPTELPEVPEAAIVPPTPQRPKYVVQRGPASWYGPKFHGKQASDGTTYDQFSMTAAHMTLPFGTPLKVTNLATGRSINVRVTDRGPYVEGRVIDLSYAAAEALGTRHHGVMDVEITVLDSSITEIPPEVYTVQFGAFRVKSRAMKFAARMRREHGRDDYYVVDPDGRSRFYRVRRGPFIDRADARRAIRDLKQHGWDSMIIREDPRLAFWDDGKTLEHIVAASAGQSGQ